MATCPHGDIDSSCCPDCLEGTPPPRQLPVAEREIEARFAGTCGLDERHRVEVNDYIGLVGGLWACRRCYRVDERTEQTWSTW